MNLIPKTWKHFNLILLFLGISLGIFLYIYQPFHAFLQSLGSLGYIGAFIAGLLYDSTITVATSIVILLVLAQELSVLEIGIIAGIGAVLGDWIVFHFVRDNLAHELAPLFGAIEDEIGARRVRSIKHMLHTKYFNWMLPVVAAILIGTPFPNELAWGLMGATKIKKYQFFLISFTFNFTGIVLILSASSVAKP